MTLQEKCMIDSINFSNCQDSDLGKELSHKIKWSHWLHVKLTMPHTSKYELFHLFEHICMCRYAYNKEYNFNYPSIKRQLKCNARTRI